MKKRMRTVLIDAVTVLAGSFLFAMSMNQFLLPGNTVLGGASGFAVVLNRLCGVNVSLAILLFNLPFLLINMKLYGARFCVKTTIGVAATSAAVEIFRFFPVTLTDPLLCAVFGAITMGIGCGIMFTRGYTTGGTDLVAWMIRYWVKRIPTGRLISACDLVIILGAAVAMQNYESIFYSLISIYLFGKIVDAVLDGAGKGKLVWIISPCHVEISERISAVLDRGITMLTGSGWYSGEEKQIMLCAVRTTELYRIKEIVNQYDRQAFVVVCDAHEVIGEGFEVPFRTMQSGKRAKPVVPSAGQPPKPEAQ